MPELFDVGAQAERTALAWQRTGIGTIAVGALVLRWCVTENFPLWPGVVLAMCGGITTLFLVRQRYQRVLRTVTTAQTPLSVPSRSRSSRRPPPPVARGPAVSGCCTSLRVPEGGRRILGI